jgi:hypothetical protein
MAEANLVITYDPAHAGKAKEEVVALLNSLQAKVQFLESDVEGLFILNVPSPKVVTKSLNSKSNANRFNYTFRWVPIDKWCSSKTEDMAKVMKEIDVKIG